jgi:transcriptional regulator with XRE-family HTH domain
MNPEHSPFSQRLVIALQRSDKTQRQVAKEAGISAPYLNRLATGKAKNPGWAIISRLAGSLGVTPAELAGSVDSQLAGRAPPGLKLQEDAAVYAPSRYDPEILLRAIECLQRAIKEPDPFFQRSYLETARQLLHSLLSH